MSDVWDICNTTMGNKIKTVGIFMGNKVTGTAITATVCYLPSIIAGNGSFQLDVSENKMTVLTYDYSGLLSNQSS